MAGLPHYKNSRAAISNFEPLYYAHFEIILTPPPSIAGWDLVMENVKKISGLDTSKIPAAVTQIYKGQTRSFAGGSIAGGNSVELGMDWEVNLNDNNSAYVYKALRQWTDLIYDPLTGRQGLKKDYIGGPMVVSWFNKQGDIHRQWKFPTVFPSAGLPAPDLDFNSNDIFDISGFNFIADYWEETIL
jgi:hypothetical protein